MIPIVLPQPVRIANGIPDEPLAIYSAWSMDDGEARGLWIGLRSQVRSGRRWPVTGVSVDEAQGWIDAAQSADPS